MSLVNTATTAASSAPGALRPAPWPVRLMFGLGGRLAPSAVGGFVARRMLTPMRRPTKPVDSGEAEVLSIADRDRQLHALSWGSPANAWVLLMHGWEGRAADMQAFVAPLIAAGLRVVALDAPAHGESPGEQTDVHDIARAIAALASRLGAPSAIVAHSLGAAASAVYLAEHQPHAPSARTTYLVLLAPGGDLEDEMVRVAATLGLPRAAVVALRACLQQHYQRPLSDCSTRAALRLLKLRGMVVHDRDDRVVRYADGVAASRALAGARLLTTEGLGHRRILRDPQAIAEVVAFCRGGMSVHRAA